MGHGLQIVEQLHMPYIELLGQRRSVHYPGQIGRSRVILKHRTRHPETGGVEGKWSDRSSGKGRSVFLADPFKLVDRERRSGRGQKFGEHFIQ
jgi:hypothetical protein